MNLDGLLALAPQLATQSGHMEAPTDHAHVLNAGYAARLAAQLDALPAPWQQCVLMHMADGTPSHQALTLIHRARSYYTHTYVPLTRHHQKPDRRRRKLFPRDNGKTLTPPALDSTVPTAARMHNNLRNGKDSSPADRAAAALLLLHVPQMPMLITQARAYLHTQIQQALSLGIEQFADLGCGLPLHPHARQDAAHDTATRHHQARTVYVDNDPCAFTHARTQLTTPTSTVVQDQLGEAGLLPRLAAAGHLDLTRPIAVLLINTLEYLDGPTAAALFTDLSETLPAGSILSIATTATGDASLAARATLAMTYNAPSIGWRLRTDIELGELALGILAGRLHPDTPPPGRNTAYTATATITVPGT